MELQLIIDIIHQKTGIDAGSMGQFAFQNATKKCMQNANIEIFEQYIEHLKSSPDAISALIEQIIVPETWFFREKNAFIALISYIKKQAPEKNNTPVNILSLPSSTGEEPYSIALTMLDAGFKPDQFSIDAMDISQKNIDKARYGLYRQNSFREQDDSDFQQRYFSKTDDGMLINDDIKQLVNFSQANIFDSSVLSKAAQYDIIFCRNMLIYFNKIRKDAALKKLSTVLKSNGVIFLGHSESGIMADLPYQACGIPRSYGFIKGAKKKKLTNKPLPPPEQRSRTSAVKLQAIKNIVRKEAQKCSQKPDEKQTNELCLKNARQLADSGNTKEALEYSIKLSEQKATSNIMTLIGLLYSSMEDSDMAETYLRKAIFLDPANHEALSHLAVIMDKKGNMEEAMRLNARAEKYRIRESVS